VGDSEANTELAFKEISALGKCVILLDEVDKVFNNNDDNQTTSRVLSILLNYMDLNKNVFWVLTGNNVSDIPPELLRKGRLDEYFYVGLPDLEAAYIYIQKRLDEFAKYGYINQDIDAKDIASMLLSYNYTFSDIVAHCDKLYVDFKNYGNDACLEFKPVSSYDRNKEAYDAIMKWSEKNAKSAN
jgi:SpoVK/Ycf46/Vps4 family AAA+-type ATPase